jgi:hypothetical protein
MNKTKEITLMYVLGPHPIWAVFDACGCPDTLNLPSWMYKTYEVPSEQYQQVFRNLLEVKERLASNEIIPSRKSNQNIFPDLSSLL